MSQANSKKKDSVGPGPQGGKTEQVSQSATQSLSSEKPSETIKLNQAPKSEGAQQQGGCCGKGGWMRICVLSLLYFVNYTYIYCIKYRHNRLSQIINIKLSQDAEEIHSKNRPIEHANKHQKKLICLW